MSKSRRLETIFHNGEPDGIRTYMRHLSPIKTYVVPHQYLSEAKGLTGIDFEEIVSRFDKLKASVNRKTARLFLNYSKTSRLSRSKLI